MNIFLYFIAVSWNILIVAVYGYRNINSKIEAVLTHVCAFNKLHIHAFVCINFYFVCATIMSNNP